VRLRPRLRSIRCRWRRIGFVWLGEVGAGSGTRNLRGRMGIRLKTWLVERGLAEQDEVAGILPLRYIERRLKFRFKRETGFERIDSSASEG
jgi:hypothetical protein